MTQLHIDPDGATTPTNTTWSFGVGVGHARMLLRDDVRRQLLLARSELGFHHVRIDGLLGEGDTSDAYDFDPVEQAIDWLLESGLMPFFVLPAPRSEALGPSWLERVEAMARAVDGRYGCDAREWHFEIGLDHAPDAAGMTPGLFEKAARRIKSVHPEYRVGGPGAPWPMVEAFAKQVQVMIGAAPEEPPVCDFIAAVLDPAGPSASDIRKAVAAALGDAIPVLFCDWGRFATGPAGSDPCACAARVARTAVELADSSANAVYAALTDITDQPYPHCEPFHGGKGLLTVNDIRKGAFHTLRLLNEHGGYHAQRLVHRWVDPVPGLGCLATKSEYTLRLLLWLDRDEAAAVSSGPARFTLEGLGEAAVAQVEVIRPNAGSAFETWLAAGRPRFVNLLLLEALEAASRPAEAEVNFHEYPPRLEPGMVMQLTIQLPFGD